MRTLRASELGIYVYCHKAWWYQRQGMATKNRSALEGGTRLHQQHGRRVFNARLWGVLAWLFLIIGLVILVSSLAWL